MTIIRINNSYELAESHDWNAVEFYVDSFGLVQERGTRRYYDAQSKKAWLTAKGQRVSLTSYEEFGADLYQARKAAACWVHKAKAAWNAYVKAYGAPEWDE